MIDYKEYKEKLRQFNATEKYWNEMHEMMYFMAIEDHWDRILDYGCGTGAMMMTIEQDKEVKIDGYDVHEHYYEGNLNYFSVSTPKYTGNWYNKIYFMHSFAHIVGIQDILKNINKHLLSYEDGRVYILTPNKDWLDKHQKSDYKQDPTIVKHYNYREIKAMLIEAGFTRILKKFLWGGERIMIKARR